MPQLRKPLTNFFAKSYCLRFINLTTIRSNKFDFDATASNQVLKLCANHHICDGMHLASQGASNKSWVWAAFDFSESQTEPQKSAFAVRFKTVEEASEFHDKFVEGVAVDRRRKAASSYITFVLSIKRLKRDKFFIIL